MTPLFIAEVSSNHQQSLDRALRFIEVAAQIGCGAVKFQMFKVEELFAPEILTRSPAHRQRSAWELPSSFLPILTEACRKHGVLFGCTPFYLEAVEQLVNYVDFFKIASYELLWKELLTACGRSGKPVMLSTGMATMEEVVEGVSTVRNTGCTDLTVLHCVSSYPTPKNECNLAAMDAIRNAVGAKVGWSDHSLIPGVIHRAVHRFGASVIEFHLDLDGQGAEFSGGHCWLPDQIQTVIHSVQEGMDADGVAHKQPMRSEIPDRVWRADPQDGLRPMKAIREDWQP